MNKKINVCIVDDSALVRQVLGEIIKTDPELELIYTAPDPIFAMDKMANQWPDVIVLDIEMPRMDGITFLKKIMSEKPTPIVVCSTLTQRNTETSMLALSNGALGVISKPTIGLKNFINDSSREIIHAIKAAAHSNSKLLKKHVDKNYTIKKPEGFKKENTFAANSSLEFKTTEKIIAIGTSTGGTQALEQILTDLPVDAPAIVIVQHMPEKFTAAFAARLNSLSNIEVKEATNRDLVHRGRALIAPGNKHMVLRRSGAQYFVEVQDGPLVSRHRPSVDVLFRSVAKVASSSAVGIIMTGMGDDGAIGMKEMHDSGSYTIAQNEETCVVFGMPKEAIKKGAVDLIVPLEQIPSEILKYRSH